MEDSVETGSVEAVDVFKGVLAACMKVEYASHKLVNDVMTSARAWAEGTWILKCEREKPSIYFPFINAMVSTLVVGGCNVLCVLVV